MTQERSSIDELADDYVLGLLDPSAQLEAEARIERDADFRRAVAASRDRFLELDLTARPTVPSETLWQRIAQQVEAVPVVRSPRPGAPRPSAANQNDRKSWWRGLAMASTAASVLLGVLLVRAILSVPDPVVIAVLVDQSGQPLAIVEDYGNAAAKVTALTDFAIPEDKSMQVWTLPSEERGPVSLGLLTSSASDILHGPELPSPKEGQLYEITLEPRNGSPTGRPTGAILVKGFAKTVR